MRICEVNKLDPTFPFFFHPQYVEFEKDVSKKRLFFLQNDNNDIIVYRHWKVAFIAIMQPLYPPLTKEGKRLDESHEFSFLEESINYIKQNRIADRIIQPENFAIFKCAPSKAVYIPFGTYFLNLSLPLDILWTNIHSKHRNVIRNAEKKEIRIIYGKESIHDFYDLYLKTMQRANMDYEHKKFFLAMYNSIPNNIICGVAYADKTPIGGLFIPYSYFGAFYIYGASADNTKVNGAINLLHWNTIKLLKEKGVNRYDFVGARLSDIKGTKLEGIQKFKARFGSELEKGCLWKIDIIKWKCIMYDLLLRKYWFLKGLEWKGDIIDQELIK